MSTAVPKGECVICFYPLQNGEKIAVTECGHIYHNKCIVRWFDLDEKKRCPLCNTGKVVKEVYPPEKRWYCCFLF